MNRIITTLILIVLFWGFTPDLNSQNLVINGDLETWTGGTPDGWSVVENITQETTIVHGGTSSARHTSASSTKDFRQEIGGIQEGQEYTISYWYYDNDPAARTRIWSYWTSAGANLPDNADVLRPSTYSEDNPGWVQFTAVLTAPATADGFKFEVRVYNQDGNFGGSVFYDDFEFTGETVINPEPTNYPTDFTATAVDLSIDLTWTDATGTQLPSGYLIVAADNPSLPVPQDGTPVANDADLSDGSGALNVAYGVQTASFDFLNGNTTYYFAIYPYTNSGANIDYKNDGTAPQAQATTANWVIIEAEDFDVSWGNWSTISVIGDQVWDRNNNYGINSTPCAQMSGYSGGPLENEDWLISPGLMLDNYVNEELVFFTATNYSGPALECLVSSDYAGSGDPNLATWQPVSFTPSPGNWTWTESGTIDLSVYSGTVYVAFKYTSNTSGAASWEVDEIVISGQEDFVINPEPTNYPTDFTATPGNTFITLNWTDATGDQLPDGYLIFASTSSTLPVPEDGTPVANDPDLSDGDGALNVAFGVQTAMFENLDAATTYYFTIYPYTNSGANIDYKTDGTAPTANATTTLNPEPTNYPTDFTASAGTTVIDLTWTDATGGQLPDAYIIVAGTDPSLPVPVDGTPIPDDTNLADGSGALNVSQGVGQASFAGLAPQTTYYFAIYPYTNSGAYIDFKTDGTAPTAEATTSYSPVIIEANFDVDWDGFTAVSVTGAQEWSRDNNYGINNTPCARMSGYSGGAVTNEDWLISPVINIDNYDNVVMTFYTARNYDGEVLELKASTDYSGSGDPNAANWTDLTFTPSQGSWEWTWSGEVSLSQFSGNTLYVAFVYYSDDVAAATWEVDDILIEEIVTNPEPANYPEGFTASATGTTINLEWIDATGTQLPEAYLIVAGTDPSLAVPQDGTPVEDDTDLSDGTGALNIDYGVQQASFAGLEPATTYYFAIYPYTNSGSAIDYKNDGTAPSASATTANVTVVTIEYENFDESWGNWTTISVTGDQVWDRDNTFGINNTPCASMSGYSGQTYENEDWLISPAMNFDEYENEKITFYNANNYSGPDMEFLVSEDWDGVSDPNTANWTSLNYIMSPGSWTWTLSGEIDLSGFNGNTVYVAFKYTSTSSSAKTWEVDEIMITGEQETVILPEPTNYPTDFTASSSSTTIVLNWTDATGEQLPEHYLIYAGTDSSLPVPQDGTPVADDTDLSDGLGALNVDYGEETAAFANLDQATTYYFTIYPYTNSGVNTDYKNDGTAPSAEATTGISPVIEYQNFDNGFDDWTTVSVTGAQEWQVDQNYGFPNPPCARVNGYSGGPVANEDWLISPAMNLASYDDVTLTFYNAKNYDGPDMELLVSTDYSGTGDPNSANWTQLSYEASTGFFEWVESGEISLSDYLTSGVYVAFKYTSTDAASSTWEVDEILIKSNFVLPEPDNYPGNFSADASGSTILVTWDDATGGQLPEAYLLYGSTDPSLPVPQDGTPVSDDTDLSDGFAAVNVAYGEEEFSFSSLPPNTQFYFTIYPYTNTGSDINYKTDGTPPEASATSGNVTVVTIEYENFDESWGNWTTISVVGDQVWDRNNTFGINNTPCASMTGYSGQSYENDDWLISPPLDLDSYQNEKLVFMNAQNYTGPDLELLISEDYDGGNDPGAATWTQAAFIMSGGSWSWVSSGDIDLSGFNGSAVYVAFRYTSTTSSSATWEIDEILITGEEEYVVKPEPDDYPASFTATGMGTIVKTTWDDAVNGQVPDGYVIFAADNENLPVPQDGSPVQLDSDLSDGSAAVIVEQGVGSYTFNQGLQEFTTYYFSIYPFTNQGNDINYKNDGTAPTASAQTTAVQLVEIESEGFDQDWGLWTRISLTGEQEWSRNNSYGLNGSPCAAMSGYSNQNYFENDDWLISPPLDFTQYINEKLTFWNAQNYNGPALEALVSTDYDGGADPTQATWTPLDFNASAGGFEWTESGAIDLSGYESDQVYVAFRFTSTNSSSATWELDNITITGEMEIGIAEHEGVPALLYPNPASDQIRILDNDNRFTRIEISDLAGRVVLSETITGNQAIRIKELPAGVWLVRLTGNKQQHIEKLIIRK
ncbi:MAG: hypothetical protein Kow00127_21780 [Bacteroidales bacterium]